MSSNIRLKRICQLCAKEFEAKTTVTKYCGDQCSKRAYKVRQRAFTIDSSNLETKDLKTRSLNQEINKPFLTVSEAAKLLNCSIRTTYRLINERKLLSINLFQRKTIIRRSDIDGLFFQEPVVPACLPKIKDDDLDPAHCYTVSQILTKYEISEKGLYDIINRNNIQKLREGKFVYVPKAAIDKLFI